ncbi:flagellar basal body L-ring protein FlgH [Pseudogulbenkiania subflava]|uniref:Flagellar L-ring protein n=1 Tax=Pseudogulbenkiania subflava DSM 22618 TaxID=1123014 RepID=A0A1Y6BJU0_9NEIS|nr:flagellar basal body L-ring protein FlgH [Pseudogulbenkiania subflava]SMF06796.1 flagellar L-ring protein precursor FlgH [Pseudogulbenkiania subflava DSM 22618]
MKRTAFVLATLLLAGCTQTLPPPHAEFDPPLPPKSASRGVGGGVFAAGGAWSLVTDSRAYRVGDALTVVLEETTQASKKAGTLLDKKSGASIQPTILGSKTINTKVGIDADRTFDGSSSSTQQNALSGALSVIVHQVLPNGLLLVKGEKQLTLNQGEEYLQLAGYVRVDDIDTDNRVSSQRIANARIAYSGRGVLSDANAPGWLTRFFTSPWMPF